MKIIPFEKVKKSAMYKLVLIFIILAYGNAKTVKKYMKQTPVALDAEFAEPRKVCLSDVSKDTLWVLDLNDDELNFKQLRSPNKMDRRVFREVMEPAIKSYKYHQLSTAGISKNTAADNSKIDMEEEEISKYDLKKQILRMFNKFVMPYQGEPSLHFNLGDNNKVSTKLYFKGPYTSLVIRYKNKRWNYFLKPPSSLPHWFYEKHANVTRSGQALYVEIPDSVRNEFYGKFFYLLQGFLSFVL